MIVQLYATKRIPLRELTLRLERTLCLSVSVVILLLFGVNSGLGQGKLPKGWVEEYSPFVSASQGMPLAQGDEYFRLDEDSVKRQSDSTQIKTNKKPLPYNFKERYFHHELIYEKDSVSGKKVGKSKIINPFVFDDILKSSNLQKSGSIVRGLTIGSNRDLTVNSGFRMQLSGNLTDDIEVTAALTDENSPIQPEGTTQTLQEIDKVFVNLRSRNVSATLGDFNLDVVNGEFGGFSRKLQGAKVDANYQTSFANGNITASGATTRGKYNTQSFIGIDGVQGPYRLLGKNGERDVIVIAGTEKVYLNGEKMVRGETNDYIIEYGTGEVTFSSRRVISNASRITIDFEYTDRQYNRTILSAKAGSQFLKDKYSIDFSFAKESDDYDSPVDLQLSDFDKSVLESAGGSRLQASRSGVDSVGAGKGNYIRIDTSVYSPSNQVMIPMTIYRFNPLDTVQAIYLVQFTYVGTGIGDYEKVSVGNYVFKGIGEGSYLPIRLLPLPEQHSMMDVVLTGKPIEQIHFSGEFAHSNFDKNRFSTKDDTSSGGDAYNLKIGFTPPNIELGNTNLGSLSLNISERYITRHFNSLDRMNEIEFDRVWGTANQGGDERIRQYAMTYNSLTGVSVSNKYGSMTRDQFSSKRYAFGLDMKLENLPDLTYTLEDIRTLDDVRIENGYWLRQHGNSSYKINEKVGASFRFESEKRQLKTLTTDSLRFGSYDVFDFGPGITIKDIGKLSFTANVGWRLMDSLRTNQNTPRQNTFSQNYGMELSEWHSFSSKIDVTHQRITRENMQPSLSVPDNSLQLRWNSKYNPFERGIESDWYYEVASERTAKMERVFQRVPKGQGNYIYAGDLNNNHIIDEPDFQPTRFDGEYIAYLYPTETYIPAINLKTSARIGLNGNKLVDASTVFGKVLGSLSAESYARIEEQSTEPDKKSIYFLNFNKFLNETTTLNGNQLFTQDVYVLENNQDVNVRFRFSQSKGLTQYASQSERKYTREQSVRLRWSLLKEISQQIDYVLKDDNLLANQFSTRTRNVNSEALSSDISYRPQQELELGIKFSFGSAMNYSFSKAELNDQSVRVVYSFQQAGQARLEFLREEALITNNSSLLPFELTNGRVAGKTWIVRLQGDYRLTKFLQATLNYEGRVEGERDAVHTGRAEVKAFF